MLHDGDIREPLFDFLEERLGKIRIIEEKTMGRSRADIVMVLPEALAGIEIKSDADSYARLARQVEDYDRYFDFNYVVVGSTHAAHIREHVPGHWGVISVEEPEAAGACAHSGEKRYVPLWLREQGVCAAKNPGVRAAGAFVAAVFGGAV